MLLYTPFKRPKIIIVCYSLLYQSVNKKFYLKNYMFRVKLCMYSVFLVYFIQCRLFYMFMCMPFYY